MHALTENLINYLFGLLQGLQKDKAADITEGLFDAESPVYIQTITWCGGSLAVLTVIFLVYEILTRKKRNPNPRRYGKILVFIIQPIPALSGYHIAVTLSIIAKKPVFFSVKNQMERFLPLFGKMEYLQMNSFFSPFFFTTVPFCFFALIPSFPMKAVMVGNETEQFFLLKSFQMVRTCPMPLSWLKNCTVTVKLSIFGIFSPVSPHKWKVQLP